VVPFSSITSLALWRYLATRPDARPVEPLFITTRDRALNKYGVRDVVVSLGDRAGVDNAHPHRFRHTFAINFLRNGGNLLALQDLLGHERMDTVRIYAKQAEVDLERQQKGASPADRWKL